jgi:hypothetical protein
LPILSKSLVLCHSIADFLIVFGAVVSASFFGSAAGTRKPFLPAASHVSSPFVPWTQAIEVGQQPQVVRSLGALRMTAVIQVSQIHYPESDGKPMGETDEHREAMVRHIELLQDYFREQNVYVSGDLLVYYEQGNPRKFVVPDAFVVKNLRPGKRRTYKIWVEGKVPDVVVETTSRRTRAKDTRTKPDLYARLGIKEYFLFDPHQEYLDPSESTLVRFHLGISCDIEGWPRSCRSKRRTKGQRNGFVDRQRSCQASTGGDQPLADTRVRQAKAESARYQSGG